MSVKQQNNVPKKGDIIINTKTQRPVKVGSRTWLKLVKDGLVEGRYSDPNELYEVKEPAEVEGKIEELNKTLPRGQQAVRGRGKYKNKIVRRQKRPDPQELTEYTARTAARTIAQNVDLIELPLRDNAVLVNSSGDTYEDLETQLEKMILAEMMVGEPQAVRQVRRGRPKKAPVQQEQYYTQAPQEYDEQELGPYEDQTYDADGEELEDVEEKQFYEYE